MVEYSGVDLDLIFVAAGIQTVWTPPAPNQSVKVFRIVLTVALADPEMTTTLSWYSGANKLPGSLFLKDGGSVTLGLEQRRWLMTEAGEPLRLGLSTAGEIKGALTIEAGAW